MKKKPIAKRVSKKQIIVDETPIEESAMNFETPVEVSHPQKQSAKYPWWSIILIILLAAGGVFLAANRGVILAAVVDGQPIFRWDLNSVLAKRYGTQTLEGMITERLIADEAQKENVNVTQDEIDKRAKDILQSFGSNLTIDDFLKFQGMQKADFDNQIRLQVMVQKLLTKDLTLTDTDLDGYIATNQATLVATDPAKLREEARNAIIEKTVSDKLDAFLKTVKEKASIQRFL